MHPDIAAQLSARQAKLDGVFAMELSEAQLLTLAHVVDFEETNLKLLKPQTGRPQNFRAGVLVPWMRSGLPMPAPPNYTFPTTATQESVVERFGRTSQELMEFFADQEPGVVVSDHPMLGRLSAIKVVEILDAHLEYHGKRPPFR